MTKLRFIFIPFAILSLLFGFSISADETMEEVVVMGKPIKASQQSAIEAKRLTDNVADIISADAPNDCQEGVTTVRTVEALQVHLHLGQGDLPDHIHHRRPCLAYPSLQCPSKRSL